MKEIIFIIVYILVCGTVFADKNKIDESFDHSEEFFKCKAYVYGNTIPKKTIEKCNVYKIQEEK